ncbi:MAG: class I SAM-dependent methyltransferase [Melioribacteraceae bacterium]|jgi:SAM-dependent methyltransferase|nr:class I SAM-dependent methyltransferase [Melioribacteraceae bacterium]
MGQWYEDWFASDLYLDVYKHRNVEDAQKLLKLITDNLSVSKNDLILDAACGAGRYSNLLLKNGYKVIGFDLSLPLLKNAQKNSKKIIDENIFFRGDIRSVQLKKKFGLILNVFTSFGYFETDEENFMFINNSINFLNEHGYFVFDFINKEQLIKNLVPYSERNDEDFIIKETRRIDNNRVIKNIEIHKENEIFNFTESVRLYNSGELIKVFQQTGYKVINVFGNYEGDEYNTENSERFILFLQK